MVMKSNSETMESSSRLGVETRGIEHVPESQRHGTIARFASVWVGAQLSFNVIILGWLPASFGLTFWESATCITAGLLVGLIFYGPFALLGFRGGTNSSTASGAVFGVVGRLIGSIFSVVVALAFFALVVWSGGAALVSVLARLFGTTSSDLALVVCFALMGSITILLAVYGFAWVVRVQVWISILVGAAIAVGFFALAGTFQDAAQGQLVVAGNPTGTWMLGALIAFSVPISYGPFVGDYSRYLSETRYTGRQVVAANTIGMFVGCWAVMLFGAFIGAASSIELGPVDGLVSASPNWFLAPILMIALVGTLAQGALALYGTGLDIASIFPGVRRWKATLVVGLVGVGLVYFGQFVWSVIDLVNDFVMILSFVISPWMLICLIGVARQGWRFDVEDLQVFNDRRRGGRYWYRNGWEPRAVVAWLGGVTFGMLFSPAASFPGPLAGVFGGVDVSVVGSLLTGGAIYLLLLKLTPLPRASAHAFEVASERR
ncbi:purine-cytosine permease family protein [Microbacterium alcoholitolerans]|uniref:purine-cytosine permease family protein n=1 Tax=unclassified Microbacterium TaxID=2609290 RepID=UPI003D16DE9A